MNIVNLYGRLTKEPELRYSQSGMANVFFTIAVDRGMSREKRQEAMANNQPTADFISCKAFGKTAEMLGNYFHKGNRILVEGRIQTGSYDKNGQRVFTTDIIVNRVHFVESAGEGSSQGFSPMNQGGGQFNQAPPTNMGYQNNQAPGNNSFGPKTDDQGYYPIDNDDIPF